MVNRSLKRGVRLALQTQDASCALAALSSAAAIHKHHHSKRSPVHTPGALTPSSSSSASREGKGPAPSSQPARPSPRQQEGGQAKKEGTPSSGSSPGLPPTLALQNSSSAYPLPPSLLPSLSKASGAADEWRRRLTIEERMEVRGRLKTAYLHHVREGDVEGLLEYDKKLIEKIRQLRGEVEILSSGSSSSSPPPSVPPSSLLEDHENGGHAGGQGGGGKGRGEEKDGDWERRGEAEGLAVKTVLRRGACAGGKDKEEEGGEDEGGREGSGGRTNKKRLRK
ncbi:hypothetical protein NSK_000811 [Nannochloropsis salina CCMP1776]|uniref:Uncharacterized protein n=1 Tax=Nannochloropsis salina CCMP1776 TaxID=1027361 RepID=A0A4D9DFD6_9STRA|nr:hypothetical protein NSK_000811 [Nannochloropsis salina CCMP1776]|eukprot:TFJ87458.1 hypothetical protein NSK_000811 [Nannochloropsis salina CCMP1776]